MVMIREDNDREIEVSISKRGHVEFNVEIPNSEYCMYFNLRREEASALRDLLDSWLSNDPEAEVP